MGDGFAAQRASARADISRIAPAFHARAVKLVPTVEGAVCHVCVTYADRTLAHLFKTPLYFFSEKSGYKTHTQFFIELTTRVSEEGTRVG